LRLEVDEQRVLPSFESEKFDSVVQVQWFLHNFHEASWAFDDRIWFLVQNCYVVQKTLVGFRSIEISVKNVSKIIKKEIFVGLLKKNYRL
jgi:hypothetical protein